LRAVALEGDQLAAVLGSPLPELVIAVDLIEDRDERTNAAGRAFFIETRNAACTAMTTHSIQSFSSLSRSTCHRKWNFFRERPDISKE
jgi:hypothetical protein